MKTWHQSILAAWAWAALAGGIHAETSSFTHSGMLQNNDSPANGLFDLEVTLHSSEFDNTPVGDPSTVSIPSLPITDGLFLITLTLRPPDGWAYFHLDNGP